MGAIFKDSSVETAAADKTKAILDALKVKYTDHIWAAELRLSSGARRCDFWVLQPHASKGYFAQAFEIKVSRQDFKRDHDLKQRDSRLFSDRFWYVTPPGLAQTVMDAARRGGRVIVAWGAHPKARQRRVQVLSAIRSVTEPLCFGVNRDGSPKHPCYLGNGHAVEPYTVTFPLTPGMASGTHIVST